MLGPRSSVLGTWCLAIGAWCLLLDAGHLRWGPSRRGGRGARLGWAEAGRGVAGIALNKKHSLLVSWFQRSKFHRFKNIEYVLENVDPIWPNSHFMFSGRYWSHIQDFEEFVRRIIGIFRHLSLRTFSTRSSYDVSNIILWFLKFWKYRLPNQG